MKYFFNIVKKIVLSIILLMSFIRPSFSLELVQKIDKAAEYVETGKPDSAAVLLNNVYDIIEDKDERVRALFYLSQAMKDLGYLNKEIQYLIMAREESPDAAFADRVNFAYSRVLLKTGNFDGCIGVANEFRTLYQNSPLLPEILFIAGNAHLSKGEYRRAFNIFNEIIKNYDESNVAVESIMKIGLCLYKLNLINGAIEHFENYLSKGKNGENKPEALYYVGSCYEKTKQPELAVKAYKKLVIDYPSYPKFMEVYFKLGEILFDMGNLSGAENIFLNYIANTEETDNNHNEALLYLERIAFGNGEYSSEIDIYENFVSKYPENPLSPKMLFDLAKYYKTIGKSDEAFEKYTILITNYFYADFADSAAFLMADTYSSIDKREEAITFLRTLASETSDSLWTQKILLKIGSLFEKWELNDVAISWYDSTYTFHTSPDLSVQALIGIGRVFKKLDRWMESGKTYERIINEYPDSPYIKDVYLALSDIFFLEGNLKKAVSAAEEAIRYAGGNEKTDILLHIAYLYEEIDKNRALELYPKVFENNMNSSSQISQALLKYGDLLLKMGSYDSAVNAYEKVISNNTDSLFVKKAREKLSSIDNKQRN